MILPKVYPRVTCSCMYLYMTLIHTYLHTHTPLPQEKIQKSFFKKSLYPIESSKLKWASPSMRYMKCPFESPASPLPFSSSSGAWRDHLVRAVSWRWPNTWNNYLDYEIWGHSFNNWAQHSYYPPDALLGSGGTKRVLHNPCPQEAFRPPTQHGKPVGHTGRTPDLVLGQDKV